MTVDALLGLTVWTEPGRDTVSRDKTTAAKGQFSTMLRQLETGGGITDTGESSGEDTTTVIRVMSDGSVLITVYEGDKIVLKPWTIQLDNGYSFTYTSMRYSRLWFTDKGSTANWAFYNTAGVPMLPAEMTLIPGTRASVSDSASAMRQRTATKASIHHGQRKSRGTLQKSVAKRKSTRTPSPTKD